MIFYVYITKHFPMIFLKFFLLPSERILYTVIMVLSFIYNMWNCISPLNVKSFYTKLSEIGKESILVSKFIWNANNIKVRKTTRFSFILEKLVLWKFAGLELFFLSINFIYELFLTVTNVYIGRHTQDQGRKEKVVPTINSSFYFDKDLLLCILYYIRFEITEKLFSFKWIVLYSAGSYFFVFVQWDLL